MTEATLLYALLLEAPKQIPHVRLFRRQVMMVTADNRTVRIGLRGQSDLYGVVRGGGHLEIELKALSGRLSDDQANWFAWCRMWDVPCLLLRPLKDEPVPYTIRRWCGEINVASRIAASHPPEPGSPQRS